MTQGRSIRCVALVATLGLLGVGCEEGCDPSDEVVVDHGPIAADISAPLGEIIPSATAEQRETFERGKKVALKRFDRAGGLGPAFNVTFCAACHEKPVTGGSAGTYRSFFLSGFKTESGAFFPGESAGRAGGVIRMYAYGDENPARPTVPGRTNVVAQRNAVPFFGVGLIAGLPGESILANADPDDLDGDGISGRPNSDRGFVGRFGLKSQTTSIEGFIRGPMMNHAGITTDPLTDEQRGRLPVDSSESAGTENTANQLGADANRIVDALMRHAQAAANDGPLEDDDGVADPEMTRDELFDVVSFAMLLAAPPVQLVNDETRPGQQAFDAVGCAKCHVPRLASERGPLPVYSDLLLHDMGESLADGLEQGEATGREFRTQPLWGVAANGPYLHDGRAFTIEEAILAHDGEGRASRNAYAALDAEKKVAIETFLLSLGGVEQYTAGLIPPGDPAPEVGEYGGPVAGLSADEQTRFGDGRLLFDREFGFSEGKGGPRFNGDSCRACHFDPVVGGSGPRGVNVMRHGIINADGEYVEPSTGSILHKVTSLITHSANRPEEAANIFEHRQTPHLFGLGLLEQVSDDDIMSLADADDLDGDGISGRVSIVDGGRLGRFGWKGQVPSIDEFIRDAVTMELGMTLPPRDGLTFGRIHDNDDIPDPEFTNDNANLLADYLRWLGPPPRQPIEDASAVTLGEMVFDAVGCAQCHVPTLPSAAGPVAAYTDLLLHDILEPGAPGIEEGSANMQEFRTAPLWGLATTAPYLHNGNADTIEEAILGHAGEGRVSKEDYEALNDDERSALLLFLNTL